MKTAIRQLIVNCLRNAQFDFGSCTLPCNDDWFENLLPPTQFEFYQRIANLPGALGGYSPQFENGCKRFGRGVLDFAGRIGVGGLDADMPGKLQNGFLDF